MGKTAMKRKLGYAVLVVVGYGSAIPDVIQLLLDWNAPYWVFPLAMIGLLRSAVTLYRAFHIEIPAAQFDGQRVATF